MFGKYSKVVYGTAAAAGTLGLVYLVGRDTSPPVKPFPDIKSKHSLVAKHVTLDKWTKLSNIKTETSGFTLDQAIACAVQFDNQHCGIYAGDADSYKDFALVFDPLIQEYHGISADSKHTSDMDVKSTRIRVGRSIDGFGLSQGITQDQRLGVESLMKKVLLILRMILPAPTSP